MRSIKGIEARQATAINLYTEAIRDKAMAIITAKKRETDESSQELIRYVSIVLQEAGSPYLGLTSQYWEPALSETNQFEDAEEEAPNGGDVWPPREDPMLSAATQEVSSVKNITGADRGRKTHALHRDWLHTWLYSIARQQGDVGTEASQDAATAAGTLLSRLIAADDGTIEGDSGLIEGDSGLIEGDSGLKESVMALIQASVVSVSPKHMVCLVCLLQTRDHKTSPTGAMATLINLYLQSGRSIDELDRMLEEAESMSALLRCHEPTLSASLFERQVHQPMLKRAEGLLLSVGSETASTDTVQEDVSETPDHEPKAAIVNNVLVNIPSVLAHIEAVTSVWGDGASVFDADIKRLWVAQAWLDAAIQIADGSNDSEEDAAATVVTLQTAIEDALGAIGRAMKRRAKRKKRKKSVAGT